MITLEQALARADTMTGCTETQEVVKVLAAEVTRLEAWFKIHQRTLGILGAAYEYVQTHPSEFSVGPGEDITPVIVKAFLDSRPKEQQP